MGGDSMLALLEKTRMINKLLQNTEVISYKKMAEVLKDVIKANIYIVSSEGDCWAIQSLMDLNVN